MAKALTNIKTGSKVGGDLKLYKVGDDVPDDVAKANPHAVERKVKPTIDPNKPGSYAGVAAAQESIDARPDNPNRPATVVGEADLKVTKGAGASPSVDDKLKADGK